MLVFSHTQLKAFEQCPLQYKLKYLDSISEPVENIEVFLGKRVHEVLEQLYRTLEPEKPPRLKELLATYRTAWDERWNSNVRIVRGDAVRLYFSYGEKCIQHFYNTFVPFNQSATLYLEHRLEFPLDEAGTCGIQGYADRISVRSDGVYEIHDYKTGRRSLTQRDADSDRQLSLYEIGFRVFQPTAKKIELVWHCLGVGVTLRSHRTPGQRARIRKSAQELIDHIERQTQFPANKTRLCDWCAYRAICPAWTSQGMFRPPYWSSGFLTRKHQRRESQQHSFHHPIWNWLGRLSKKLSIWLTSTKRPR
jgi:putative RecB family exonuclease